MSTRRKRQSLPPPPPPPPPSDPSIPAWASRPVDWSKSDERTFWLARLRIHLDDLVNAAIGALDVYSSPVPRDVLSDKITRAANILRHLLHTAGAYPPVTPVPEENYCGICGTGPFSARACPECGETDDLPRWPRGARRT
jgi:hypothetical protein